MTSAKRIVGLAAALICLAQAPLQAAEVSMTTSDGVRVYGDLYSAGDDRSAPLILLFHQGGGDARGEYSDIAPRLIAAGYHALAIDQRAGGERFEQINRTAAGQSFDPRDYCSAYPDLVAALEYARGTGFDGPLAVWGSSYSAALVFKLAAKFPDEIDAVLAFSAASGPPLADCPVDAVAGDVQAPVLALRPANEAAIESVQAQMADFEARGFQTWIADPGVHGSSMLNAERVGADTEPTWNVVIKFLQEHLTPE